MAVNSYDESLTDSLKRFAPTLIAIGAILAVLLIGFFGFRWYQDRNGTEAVSSSNFIRDYNFRAGKKDASVKLVYGFDLQCPACKTANTPLKEFAAEYKDKIEFVYKNFPLSIHPFAKPAAYGLQASQRQDKFLDYKDKIFESQSQLNTNTIEKAGQDLGLDMNRWNSDRNSREIRDQVDQDSSDFTSIKLPNSTFGSEGNSPSATPSHIIIKDGKIVDWWSGGVSVDDYKIRIDKYLN